MRRWTIAAALGCAAVATAYLPPTVVDPDRHTWLYQANQLPERKVERRISQALQRKSRDLQGLERAELLARRVRERGPRVASGPTLIFQGRAVDRTRNVIRAAFDSLWRRVQPVSEESGFLAVVDLEQGGPHITALPSVTDGRTCAAYLPAAYFDRPSMTPARLRRWLARGMAKCAYYAAFGPPGQAVERWLAARRYDVASEVDWQANARLGTTDEEEELPFFYGRIATFWYFRFNRPLLNEVACAQGYLIRCRAVAFTRPVEEFPWRPLLTLPAGVVAAFEFESFATGLIAPYLSDLVREMGRERFARFWRSPLPVDSAFAEAFGIPIEEWTHRWERAQLRFVPATTAVRPLLALQGALVVLAALAAVSLYSTRRQVG